jgi:phage-related protein
MRWTVEFHPLAQQEADAQPQDIRTKLQRYLDIISRQGLDHLPPKGTKHLRDDVWELRLTGRDGIARALYITRRGRRLIIVRVFAKKTQKTPPREIDLAMQRGDEVQ